MEQIKKDLSIKEVTDKAAYLVKNQLKKVSLKDSAVEFLIEYVLPLHLVPLLLIYLPLLIYAFSMHVQYGLNLCSFLIMLLVDMLFLYYI